MTKLPECQCVHSDNLSIFQPALGQETENLSEELPVSL